MADEQACELPNVIKDEFPFAGCMTEPKKPPEPEWIRSHSGGRDATFDVESMLTKMDFKLDQITKMDFKLDQIVRQMDKAQGLILKASQGMDQRRPSLSPKQGLSVPRPCGSASQGSGPRLSNRSNFSGGSGGETLTSAASELVQDMVKRGSIQSQEKPVKRGSIQSQAMMSVLSVPEHNEGTDSSASEETSSKKSDESLRAPEISNPRTLKSIIRAQTYGCTEMWEFLEDPEYSKNSRNFSYASRIIIAVSVCVSLLQSVQRIEGVAARDRKSVV